MAGAEHANEGEWPFVLITHRPINVFFFSFNHLSILLSYPYTSIPFCCHTLIELLNFSLSNLSLDSRHAAGARAPSATFIKQSDIR